MVTGSLLQSAGLVRISVQLVEVTSGTVLWSHAAQVPVDDMFQIQDAVCSAVVEALALPLSSREQRLLRRDVPASSEAYAHYLRANRLSTTSSQWPAALESYQRAVEADPSYAPAWARFGRCLRIMSKYGFAPETRAWRAQGEEAMQRAFRINPDLSLAHHLYTHFEVEAGRSVEAIVRLLGRVRSCSSDPELYAGLVHACRYVGLLDASIAAYHRATRLDPAIRTSIAHSFFMKGDFARTIELDVDTPAYLTVLSLQALGRPDDAIGVCRAAYESTPANENLVVLVDALAALLEGNVVEGKLAIARLLKFPMFSDPEGLFYWAQLSAGVGDLETALDLLSRAVDTGLYCAVGFETSPLLSVLRPLATFTDILERARARQDVATKAFVGADGPRLLGLPLDAY